MKTNSELDLGSLYYKDTNGCTRAPTRNQIEQLAYNFYLRRGKKPGHDLEDWLEAEKHLQEIISWE